MGEWYAQLIQGQRTARALWARSHRDILELWLLTDEIDADTEQLYYGLGMSLHAHFPAWYVRVHVINPALFEDGDRGHEQRVPPSAEQIPLRPAT